jgi:hypothetical protein
MNTSRILQSKVGRAISRHTSALTAAGRYYSCTSASSLPMKAGTSMSSIGVFKGIDAPVVKEREEYPAWVGKLSEPLPSLAKLRKLSNEEADDRDILRFLKMNRRISIRERNEEKGVK